MKRSTPPEAVHTWLENLPAEKKPLIEALRQLIGSVAPSAHEILSHDALGMMSYHEHRQEVPFWLNPKSS